MNKYEVKNNENPFSESGEDTEADGAERQKLIHSFGSYTTLHGFHFLIDSGSTVRRILWLVLMIVCLVILGFQLENNYTKLRRHDSLITKDSEHSRSLQFPAVSICNQNILQKNKILGTEAQLYLDSIDSLKGEYMGSTDRNQALRQANSSFDMEKAVREAGHNLTTMMTFCSWRGQKCGAENFTSFISFYVCELYVNYSFLL